MICVASPSVKAILSLSSEEHTDDLIKKSYSSAISSLQLANSQYVQ